MSNNRLDKTLLEASDKGLGDSVVSKAFMTNSDNLVDKEGRVALVTFSKNLKSFLVELEDNNREVDKEGVKPSKKEKTYYLQ